MEPRPNLAVTVERSDRAHEIALRLLSVRARSESEIRKRLAARGIDTSECEAEVLRLRSAGLLDDAAFASAWVESRNRAAPRGTRLLRQELALKGVDRETARSATSDVDDSDAALALARSRAHGPAMADYETFVTRVGGFLRRRGFDYATANGAVRTAWNEASGDTATSADGNFHDTV